MKVQIWGNLGVVVLKKNNYFKEMQFNWGESVIFAEQKVAKDESRHICYKDKNLTQYTERRD